MRLPWRQMSTPTPSHLMSFHFQSWRRMRPNSGAQVNPGKKLQSPSPCGCVPVTQPLRGKGNPPRSPELPDSSLIPAGLGPGRARNRQPGPGSGTPSSPPGGHLWPEAPGPAGRLPLAARPWGPQ